MRAAILVLLLSAWAFAGDDFSATQSPDEGFGFATNNPGPDLWITHDEVHGMSVKIVRGIVDLATGWLEFPRRIVASAKEKGPYPAFRIAQGVLEGAGMAGARTLGGALELGTFWSPYPEKYHPLYEPTYSFE